LQARCAVIAAANPLRGRYDSSLTFVENVDLTDPILSRFDVLAVVRDKVDPVQDEMLANFVVANHIKSHPENAEKNESEMQSNDLPQSHLVEHVPQEMLRKYILFGKRTIHPKLDNIDRDKISKFYADLRQKSMEGGGIPIAVRHIESILRLSEARAKLHLREYVRDDDVDMAIRVLLESFIDTQKQSVQTSLRKHFKAYLTYRRDATELLLHLLENEVKEELYWRQVRSTSDMEEDRDTPVEIDFREFQDKAEAMNISDLSEFVKSDRFREEGFELQGKKIIKNFR